MKTKKIKKISMRVGGEKAPGWGKQFVFKWKLISDRVYR